MHIGTGARLQIDVYADLNLFGETFDRVRAEYVDAPDEKELIRAAIQGMLASLDPHSNYLPPADSDEMRQDLSGEFGGLGIEVTMEDGVVKVVSPIDETPAARAGVLANDLIVEIDGKAIQGQTLDAASGKKEDRPGLTACLKALRGGDTLVVWKLDRLGRDLRHLVNLVDDLTQRNVGLKVLAGCPPSAPMAQI